MRGQADNTIGLLWDVVTREVTEPSVIEPTEPQKTAVMEPAEEEPPSVDSNGLGDLNSIEEETYRNKNGCNQHIKDSMILVSGGIEWHIENNYVGYIQCNARRSRFSVSCSRRQKRFSNVPSTEDAAAHTCEEWIEQEWRYERFSEIEPEN